MTTRRSFCLSTFGLIGLQGVSHAQADGRAATLVVPFTASSGSDIIARIVGPRLATRWSRPVVVDNRPGASGTLGANAVVRAAPDGATLLMAINTYAMAPAMYKSLPYDPLKDLQPVTLLAQAGFALAVHPSVPAKDVASALAHFKKNAGSTSYASPGKGTPQHLAMELLKSHTGLDVLHVPYKGIAGALTDLMGNQVQVMFASVHSLLPHVRSGRLRLVAVTGNARNPLVPEVPTFIEQGIDYMEAIDAWFGVLAPAQVPRETVMKLNQDFHAVMALPEVRDELAKQGLVTKTGTPEQFGALIRADLARWAKVVKDAGISEE